MNHGLVKFIGKALMVRMYSVMVEMFCISDAFSSKGTVGDFVCFYCLSGKYFVCFASLQKHGKNPQSTSLILFNVYWWNFMPTHELWTLLPRMDGKVALWDSMFGRRSILIPWLGLSNGYLFLFKSLNSISATAMRSLWSHTSKYGNVDSLDLELQEIWPMVHYSIYCWHVLIYLKHKFMKSAWIICK